MTPSPEFHFDPHHSQIAVIGAGTMGAGIAEVFVRAGYTTYLCDASPTAVERATEAWKLRLKKDTKRQNYRSTSSGMGDSVADLQPRFLTGGVLVY